MHSFDSRYALFSCKHVFLNQEHALLQWSSMQFYRYIRHAYYYVLLTQAPVAFLKYVGYKCTVWFGCIQTNLPKPNNVVVLCPPYRLIDVSPLPSPGV